MLKSAIMEVFTGARKEVFIPCSDKSQQESTRTQAFAVRLKLLGNHRDEVGVKKYEQPDGKLFIEIYKREKQVLYERSDETGGLVPIVTDASADPELQKVISVMRLDGLSEEVIQAFVEGLK